VIFYQVQILLRAQRSRPCTVIQLHCKTCRDSWHAYLQATGAAIQLTGGTLNPRCFEGIWTWYISTATNGTWVLWAEPRPARYTSEDFLVSLRTWSWYSLVVGSPCSYSGVRRNLLFPDK